MLKPTRGPISLPAWVWEVVWADARLALVRVRAATAKARSFTGNLLCQKDSRAGSRAPGPGAANRRQYSRWKASATANPSLRTAQMCSTMAWQRRQNSKPAGKTTVRVERLNEPIRVRADFAGGSVTPL